MASWTPAEAANVWALLVSFTDPNPQVQQTTLAQMTNLNHTWAPLPYLLTEFLAHGNAANGATASPEEQSNGQQAAGTMLKQLMVERLAAVKAMAEGTAPAVQYPQLDLSAFDVPLLFAICSADRKVQMAGSTCLSQLVQYANEVGKWMVKNNADGAAATGNWVSALIGRLEQLVESSVTNNHLGVSRCLGVLMEDRNQQLLAESREAAVTGHDSEEHASMLLVQRLEHMTRFVVPVYKLLAFLVSQSNSFPAKLNALGCVAGISFLLGEPGLESDDEDEGGDVGGLTVKGNSPSRGVKFAGSDAKAARAQRASLMFHAEKSLVKAVAQSLPTIVAEAQQGCNVSTEDGVKQLLDAFTAAIKALTSIASHWEEVQPLAIAVLPTVLQWLAVFDWRQQAAKVPAIGDLTMDPSILRSCGYEAEVLRVCCLDFVTELAQQLDGHDEVGEALTAHHVAVLQQLYAAFVLDQMAVAEVCIDADRHIPDSEQDVLFVGKNKHKMALADAEEEDEDLMDDGDNGGTDNDYTGPTRTAARFCFSNIALILPPAFVFAVMDMLHPVVQRHLVAAEGGSPLPDWLELEGALAFLAEALTHGATTGDDDDDTASARMSTVSEQVAIICCRFLGVARVGGSDSFSSVTPHFAGPVRAASSRILARIGERLVYDNSPDDIEDDSPAGIQAYTAKTNHQNEILDAIMSVLYHTAANDTNKASLCAALGAFSDIIHHSYAAQADDEAILDGDDDDEKEAGAGGNNGLPIVQVGEAHIRNFYGLSVTLTAMPLSQRVCFYKYLPAIAKADVTTTDKASVFLQAREAIFASVLTAWKQLVPQLDCYESLALGDLVYEVCQSLSKEEAYTQLPSSVARTLWQDVGVGVLQTSGLGQNLLNGVDTNGLTTESVSMAIDILSSVCDTADTAVTAELFQATGIASVIASIVLPNLTSEAAMTADINVATEELLRASLGLLGDFCSVVPADQVHSVADALLSPIAHVLVREATKVNNGNLTIGKDGKSVTKTYAGGLKVTSMGGADLADLLGDGDEDSGKQRVMLGNALFCLAKLLETVHTGDELLRICPAALPNPTQLQSFVGACTVMLKFTGGASAQVAKQNLLVVVSKLAVLFAAVVDAVGGDAVLLSEASALSMIEEIGDQLDVALCIGKYFAASSSVQARAASDVKARGLILSLALAVAPTLKKCMSAATGKGQAAGKLSADIIAKAQQVHAMWAQMVAMCQDAINSAPSAKFSTTMKAKEKTLMQQVYFQ